MSLAPGRTLLHYRIVDKIGEGGMGAVWAAVDTSLDRKVAIKVLPPQFAADNERLVRFEREAKLLASLNHPNIAGVYGLHSADDVRFLAMELVEGEDLERRLARGPLALDDALDTGLQVARALEAAHAQGIVHRDLKPANVVRADDGTVKVLDFGLAKALGADPASGETDPALSPTTTSAGTQAGMILGTAAYMSPEQARGRTADARADVWAFGVTLMEMLTGRQLFTGETVSDILAEVLKSEPDWTALSPDGRLLALLVNDPSTGTSDLWVHDLARGIATRLTDTPWAEFAPKWSRDGRFIAYSADPAGPPNLFAIGVDGGEPRELIPHSGHVHYPSGWSPDGRTLLYWKGSADTGGDIWALDLGDDVLHGGAVGEPREILRTQHNEGNAAVSPDGKWLAYTSSETGGSEVYVQPYGRAGRRLRVSTDGGFRPRWLGSERLFFAGSDETVQAVTLRSEDDRLTIGRPETVLATGDAFEFDDYDLHPDGRLLISRPADRTAIDRIDVVVGWH